jgi:hypothetical protein
MRSNVEYKTFRLAEEWWTQQEMGFDGKTIAWGEGGQTPRLLKHFADDGWEVVSMTQDPLAYTFLLRRPKG